jgi:hypothetical protein
MAAIQQAEAENTALESAMATHRAHTAKAATLASEATYDQANDEAEKAVAEAIEGPHPAHMTAYQHQK